MRFRIHTMTILLVVHTSCVGEVELPDEHHSNEEPKFETQALSALCEPNGFVDGFDLSHYQNDAASIQGKTLDASWWRGRYDQGDQFVYIKATEGDDWTDEDYLASNYANARASNFIVGAYHFFRDPRGPHGTGVEQGYHFAETIKPYHTHGDLPPALDVEIPIPTDSYGRALFVAEMLDWVQVVRAELHIPTVTLYIRTGTWDTLGHPTGFEGVVTWVPRYKNCAPHSETCRTMTESNPPTLETTDPDYYDSCPGELVGLAQVPDFRQYSRVGNGGVAGNMDLDRFNGDLGVLRALVAGCRSNPNELPFAFPGEWSDGALDSTSNRFWSAYLLKRDAGATAGFEPNPGCPVRTGDPLPIASFSEAQYIHDVGGGVVLQDFYQPDTNRRFSGSTDGWTAIATRPGASKAYLLRSGFWGAYKCLAMASKPFQLCPQAGAEGLGGTTVLGAPSSEEFTPGAGGSDFVQGCFRSPGCEPCSGTPADSVQFFWGPGGGEGGCMWYHHSEPNTIHVHVPYSDQCKPVDGGGCGNVLDIVENPGTPPDSCDVCLNMSECASGVWPADGALFKTPSTGSEVYYRHGSFKHSFPNEACYHRFYDTWDGLQCASDGVADELSDAPGVCAEGSFYQKTGASTIYRLELGKLRAMCGLWSGAAFEARWGYPFEIAQQVDVAHWSTLTAAYPVKQAGGIWPPGQNAPQCGDPGYECGVFSDGVGGICHAALTCPCPVCGDGACEAGKEDCNSCPSDCGQCAHLVAGQVTSPSNGATVSNQQFDISWTQGYDTGGQSTQTALYCQTDGGAWDLYAGFGATSPRAYLPAHPGQVIACKTRTRYSNDYDSWLDSQTYTWTATSNWPAMNVTTVSLNLADDYVACSPFSVTGHVVNNGNQGGAWFARAWLHPAGGSPGSPDAIESLTHLNADLDPGESADLTFAFSGVQMPLAPGEMEATVVVTDPQGAGSTSSDSTSVFANDSESPHIDAFTLYGAPGAPQRVVPGKSYYVYFSVADDYEVGTVQLDWRQGTSVWQPVTVNLGSHPECHTSLGGNATWLVPAEVTAGAALTLRLTVYDDAGRSAQTVIPVEAGSNAEPAVQFIKPAGGEWYTRSTDAAPSCVDVELVVTPGNPIQLLSLGWTTSAHTPTYTTLGTVPVPEDGHVEICLPAHYTGDDMVVWARVIDANGTQFKFFAPGSVGVDFLAPAAPWSTAYVEPTQLPAELASGSFLVGMDFHGLTSTGSSLSLSRHDQVYVAGAIQTTITRLDFTLDDFALTGASVEGSVLADTYLEPPNHDAYYAVRAEPLNGCTPTSTNGCDFAFQYRQLAGGQPTPWQSIGTYTNRTINTRPALNGLDGPLRSPSGATLLFVTDMYADHSERTDIYRSTGDAFAKVATYEPGIRGAFFVDGDLWLLRYQSVSPSAKEFHALRVVETTGAVVDDVVVMSGGPQLYARGNKNLTSEEAYVAGVDPTSGSLLITWVTATGWTNPDVYALPTSWRGTPVASDRIYPVAVLASGPHVYAGMYINLTGETLYAMVPLQAGAAPDFDHVAVSIDAQLFQRRDLIPLSDGRLVWATSCNWNLESRLCLQFGYPDVGDCWDGDPCTTDSWDPDAAECRYIPMVCDGTGDACDGPAVCDPASGECVIDTVAAPSCGDGNACNGEETCAPTTGDCVAGTPVVVDDGLSCTLDSCDPTSGQVTHAPNDDACVAERCATSTCAPDDPTADAVTGCVTTPTTPEDDSLACTADTCDPSTGSTRHAPQDGWCVIDGACYAANAPNPANLCQLCDPTRAQTRWSTGGDGLDCDDGEYCTVGDQCVAGTCVGAVRDCSAGTNPWCQTATCDEDTEACVVTDAEDGIACDDLDVCNGHETCSMGQCVAGTPVDLTSDDPCIAIACDPLEGITNTYTTSPCDGDGDGCTVGDTCSQGTCVAGATPDCSAENDSCNVGVCASLSASAYACQKNPAPLHGASCDDDNACTTVDACDQGVCVGGSPVTCSPQDGCHLVGQCDPETGACSNPVAPETTSCDDENSCTVNDHCVGGACIGTATGCDDGNPCTTTVCTADGCGPSPVADGAACDDDDVCNGHETCAAGQCTAGTPLAVVNDDPCVLVTCDQVQGLVETYTTAACDADENGCTVGDTCDQGTCKAGPSADCSTEGDACNVGLCVSVSSNQYECHKSAGPMNGKTCDDDNACTTLDVCSQGTCTGIEPVVCAPSDACHGAGTCDPATGECSAPPAPDETPCDDGNACTDGDHCVAGVCAGAAMACDDENPCTIDSCTDGVCTSTPADDGTECSTSSACGGICAEGTCHGGTNCDDGSACTRDICDSTLGCVYSYIEGPCDDGDACTDNDMCDKDRCIGTPIAGCGTGEPDAGSDVDEQDAVSPDTSVTDTGKPKSGGCGASGPSSPTGNAFSWILGSLGVWMTWRRRGKRLRRSPC